MTRNRRGRTGVDPRVAARLEYETWIANAWASEYQQRLAFAAAYLPKDKPATRDDRKALEDLIKSLQELLLGRPLGTEPAEITQADLRRATERAAVQRVRELKAAWCRDNDRQRVSPAVTAQLIQTATQQVEFWFGVKLPDGSTQNIIRLLSKKELE